MRALNRAAVVVAFAAMSCDPNGCQPGPPTAVSVLTHHNDSHRSGLNLNETVLTPSALRSGRFHRLYSYLLDGQPYAQPLYVHGLDFGNGVKRNVLFTATMQNSVYAFDADHPAQAGAPLWRVNFGPAYPPPHTPWWDPNDCNDIRPVAGITSTPVIDLARNVIYIAAKTRKAHPCAWDNSDWEYGIHALDLRTGREVISSVSVCGAAPTGHNKWIAFNPERQLNRPGLLLDHGVLYLAFGSHCDFDPYWGFVWAYDAATLRPIASYVTTPGGSEGSIWQAGQGLTVDASGNIYFMTGNGEENTRDSPPSLGESFVKINLSQIPTAGRPNVGFAVVDYYHPGDIPGDADLGSSGPLLIPDANLLIGGGKQGKLYLLDANRMTPPLQVFQATKDPGNHHIHGAPVAFDTPSGATYVYVCPEFENLRAYRLDKTGRRFDTTPVATSDVHCSPRMPGGFMSISASGTANGIVWVNRVAGELPGSDDNGNWSDGGLEAVDAVTLARLWSSSADRDDDVRYFGKFSPPTIADGKVFINSFGADSGSVNVYGLRCDLACPSGQECVDGTCQGCTQSEIDAYCNAPYRCGPLGCCNIPNGCGGKCVCGRGLVCAGTPPEIESGPHPVPIAPTIVLSGHSRPEIPEMKPPPPPPPPVPTQCVCDARTVAKNCQGKCNIADGCGGICACSEGLSCNRQTNTCCNVAEECGRAGECAMVCGGVECLCDGGRCIEGKCCRSTCSATSKCGQRDGCGGTCSGTCGPREVCIEDTGVFLCQPISHVCAVKPWICGPDGTEGSVTTPPAVIDHPDVEYLMALCRRDPKACQVNTPHGHNAPGHHHGPM
jgi:hypothetical protein